MLCGVNLRSLLLSCDLLLFVMYKRVKYSVRAEMDAVLIN